MSHVPGHGGLLLVLALFVGPVPSALSQEPPEEERREDKECRPEEQECPPPPAPEGMPPEAPAIPEPEEAKPKPPPEAETGPPEEAVRPELDKGQESDRNPEPQKDTEPERPEESQAAESVSTDLSNGKGEVTVFPAGDVYPVYVSDPHRTGNAATMSFYSRTEIPNSGGTRAGLKAGGRFGLVRFGPSSPGGRTWQISIDAGLDALFDSRYKLDNLGWDGNYGLTATTASSSRFAYKLGLLHTSSHLGDEYMERTGRTRIDYTREEVALGARFRAAPSLATYAEVGIAYKELTEEQAAWRWQGGLEWESARRLLKGRFVGFAAFDLQLWQERDWRPDVTLQGGLAAKDGARTWRLGLEYSNGRPSLGEFFPYTEARLTLALWVDL